MGGQRIRDHGDRNGASAAAVATGAGYDAFRATAGRSGKNGEQEDRTKRESFAALHVAPRTRLVCVCPPGKENALTPHPNVTRLKSKSHGKKSGDVQFLNAVNQASYQYSGTGAEPQSEPEERVCYRNCSPPFHVGGVKADIWPSAYPIRRGIPWVRK